MSPLGFDRSGGDCAAPDSEPVTGDLDLVRASIWGYSSSPQTYRTDALSALARVEARLAAADKLAKVAALYDHADLDFALREYEKASGA